MTIDDIPVEDTLEDSSNLYYRLCGYNIHCLATALIVTIIIVIVFLVVIAVIVYFRERIFPCLEKDDNSTLDLNDISNYLLSQNNAQITARFRSKGADVEITANQTEETA